MGILIVYPPCTPDVIMDEPFQEVYLKFLDGFILETVMLSLIQLIVQISMWAWGVFVKLYFIIVK